MPIVNNELSFGLAGAQGGIIGAKGAPLVAAATIIVTDSFHEVSGAGVITTINCDALAPNSLLFLRPAAGSTWSLGTGGNITANVIITVGETVALEWDGTNVHPQGMMAGNAITRSGGSQPLTADLDLGAYAVRSQNSVNVINIKEAYGLLGDGIADDTAAFAAARLEALATGRSIYVPNGIYKVSNIDLTGSGIQGLDQKNVVLFGESWRGVKFIPVADGDTILTLSGYSCASNFSILGNGKAGIVAISMVSEQSRLSNFYIEYCERGISADWAIQGTFYNSVSGGVIKACTYGIYLATTGGGVNAQNLNTFIGIKVDGSAWDGVTIVTQEGIHIDGADGNRFFGLSVAFCTLGINLIDGEANVFDGWSESNTAHLRMLPTVNYGATRLGMHGMELWARTVNTTGTIDVGVSPTTLTVADATGIQAGKPISIANAAAGPSTLLTNVTGVSGTTVTISPGADLSATNTSVFGPHLAQLQSVLFQSQRFTTEYGSHTINGLTINQAERSPQERLHLYGGFRAYPIPGTAQWQITGNTGLDSVHFLNAAGQFVMTVNLTSRNVRLYTGAGSVTFIGPSANRTITLPDAAVSLQGLASAATSATSGTITTAMTSAAQTVFTITPTDNCTFNASGGTAGARMTFVITTGGTVSRDLTFGTNFKSQGVLATGTVAGKVFTVTFVCTNGTVWVETGRSTAM